MSVTYIHYGHSEYHPEFVDAERPYHITRSKPPVGLWGSREDARYGWIDWCRDQSLDEDEEFGFGNFDTHFKFRLTSDANILEIHSEDDILPYTLPDPYYAGLKWPGSKTSTSDHLNFQKLLDEGYDGIELFISDDYSMHNGFFNCWDCDSIVVWNSNVIQLIKEDIE